MWKKSEIWKNKKFRILIWIEMILLCIGIVGIFRGNHIVCTDEIMQISAKKGSIESNGSFYVDGDCGVQGKWLQAKGFTLSPGIYELTLSYNSADEAVNSVRIEAENASYYGLLSNPVILHADSESLSFQFYVTDWLEAEDGLRVIVDYNGTQALTVSGIEITKTNAGSRVLVVSVLVIALLLNSLLMLRAYMGKYKVSKADVLVWFGIPVLAILASFPVFVNYILIGTDTILYILRIEALADALTKGRFTGDGYLLFPAFLRMIGFPMGIAYAAYVIGLNWVTAALSYISFNGIFRNNKWIGMFGSMLYTLFPYRIWCIYEQGGIGMAWMMLFLPLLCYDFIIILRLISRKPVFEKVNPESHVKAVTGIVLLNLCFWMSVIEMMLSGKYIYSRLQCMGAVAAILLAVAVCVAAVWIIKYEQSKRTLLFWAVVVFVTVFITVYQTNAILDAGSEILHLYTVESLK